MENPKSNCCKEPVDMITTLDGSNPLRCRKCGEPCDILEEDNKCLA